MTIKIAKKAGTVANVFDDLNRRDEVEFVCSELPVSAFEVDLLEINATEGCPGVVEIDAVEINCTRHP